MQFFKSKNVKIFPCSNRGSYIYTPSIEEGTETIIKESSKIFDPEARLASEYNLTHLAGRALGKDSYVISCDVVDDNHRLLKLVLGGYYFEIFVPTNISLEDIKTWTLYILLVKDQLTLESVDNIRYSWHLASVFDKLNHESTNDKLTFTFEGISREVARSDALNLDIKTISNSEGVEYYCAAIGYMTASNSLDPEVATDRVLSESLGFKEEQSANTVRIELDLGNPANWLNNLAAKEFLYSSNGMISTEKTVFAEDFSTRVHKLSEKLNKTDFDTYTEGKSKSDEEIATERDTKIEIAKTTLLGSTEDTKDTNTIAGAKRYADALAESIRGENYDSAGGNATLTSLYTRVEGIAADGGEPNIIDRIEVGDVVLDATGKVVDLDQKLTLENIKYKSDEQDTAFQKFNDLYNYTYINPTAPGESNKIQKYIDNKADELLGTEQNTPEHFTIYGSRFYTDFKFTELLNAIGNLDTIMNFRGVFKSLVEAQAPLGDQELLPDIGDVVIITGGSDPDVNGEFVCTKTPDTDTGTEYTWTKIGDMTAELQRIEALQKAVDTHTETYDNPHRVTAKQLGLGAFEGKSLEDVRDEFTYNKDAADDSDNLKKFTTGAQVTEAIESIKLQPGEKGDDGNGISSIAKTNTEALVDTYTITFTNGDTTTFTVTNGADGADGAQGQQGIQGIPGEKGEDGHTPVITIENGRWYIDEVDTGKSAEGIKGDTGTGIASITASKANGITTVTIKFTDSSMADAIFTVEDGAQGQQGEQGIQGEQGDKGDPGTKWFTGNDIPTSTDSVVKGDLYLDLSNGDVYEYTTEWGTAIGNIKGATGTPTEDQIKEAVKNHFDTNRYYAVAFDANTGTWKSKPAFEQVKLVVGSGYTLPSEEDVSSSLNTPDPSLVFVGWCTAPTPDLNHERLTAGSLVSLTRDTVFYAIWGTNVN